MPEDRLQVLIVDDTVVYRRILSDAAAALPGVEQVQTAPHGKVALARLAQRPFDLVLLDLHMPEMDGLETLEAIRRLHPETAVIMVSGVSTADQDHAVRALAMGAVDFLAKPEGDDMERNGRLLREQLRPLFRHVQTRKNLQPPARAVAVGGGKASGIRGPAPPDLSHAFGLVLIGVSTGGPAALSELIPKLSAQFPVPVLVVQHMPPGFTASLAEHLNQYSALTVREAKEGECLRRGCVYVAPGGRHLTVRRCPGLGDADATYVVGLNDQPPEHSCRPSVDVLFRSAAAHVASRVLAVVMTGMGADGLEGVRALKAKGARVLTQSAESCVVYGMPLVVDEAGLSDESVPLDRLAARLEQLLATA